MRSDVWLQIPDTLTQHRRWIDSTLPTMSLSWNSVNALVSQKDSAGKPVVRRVNNQRVKDRGESKRRVVIIRIRDNVLYPKGAQTSAWYEVARTYAESPQ